ncbi:uncharacterized protein LOC106518409 [Austrofundulus limnaeus]|uniref:Uncharacterized protein LOC106518409 n=1 Tax=Austrofundulus limnaeus TaxID=52670 RepID=A0A2I4BBL0_AUSLI|nr:PREDICTED: uncharacterized protein LOC106518409 [Austrofundulus limnaeus]
MLHGFQADRSPAVETAAQQCGRMTPPLYITMYKQQFSSPGKVRRTELRPTSAHRRNNPQPRSDFLFPHNLLSSHKATRALPRSSTPAGSGRPLFPPVRHLSFHSPVPTCPENSDKPQHMPPINTSDRGQKLHLTEPPAASDVQLLTSLKKPRKAMDYQRNTYPLSARQLKLQARPQTSTPPAPSCFPQTQFRRCCSNSNPSYSDCYSCFHVVRPYQAGHYIIHPEFVSESQY